MFVYCQVVCLCRGRLKRLNLIYHFSNFPSFQESHGSFKLLSPNNLSIPHDHSGHFCYLWLPWMSIVYPAGVRNGSQHGGEFLWTMSQSPVYVSLQSSISCSSLYTAVHCCSSGHLAVLLRCSLVTFLCKGVHLHSLRISNKKRHDLSTCWEENDLQLERDETIRDNGSVQSRGHIAPSRRQQVPEDVRSGCTLSVVYISTDCEAREKTRSPVMVDFWFFGLKGQQNFCLLQ